MKYIYLGFYTFFYGVYSFIDLQVVFICPLNNYNISKSETCFNMFFKVSFDTEKF